jgi:hypothetical protein
MAFVFDGHLAADLLLDFKVDSKQTPVPRRIVVRISDSIAGIATIHSKTRSARNLCSLGTIPRIRLLSGS